MTNKKTSVFLRAVLLMFLCMVAFSTLALAADTNKVEDSEGKAQEAAVIGNQESVRSLLQIQEQLHNLQVANEKTRQDAEAAAARNAELLENRLNAMEKSVASQRLDEWNTMQRSSHLVLVAAGAFACFGFLVLVFAAFLQWTIINRLAAVAASLPQDRPALGAGQEHAALGMSETQFLPSSVVEQSTAQFIGLIERLEKRILDMEASLHPHNALPEGASFNGDAASNGESAQELDGENAHPAASGKIGTITLLLNKGQTLLKLDKPDAALSCFDEVLSLDAGNTDAMVKKGAALERLQRLKEAIDCYDRAIATDNTMTMAYLYKGGVFNRMERYTEALECYEQALRTQEKGRSANVIID
jgi:tetratricopeptide (TPR) repeat protein